MADAAIHVLINEIFRRSELSTILLSALFKPCDTVEGPELTREGIDVVDGVVHFAHIDG